MLAKCTGSRPAARPTRVKIVARDKITLLCIIMIVREIILSLSRKQ